MQMRCEVEICIEDVNEHPLIFFPAKIKFRPEIYGDQDSSIQVIHWVPNQNMRNLQMLCCRPHHSIYKSTMHIALQSYMEISCVVPANTVIPLMWCKLGTTYLHSHIMTVAIDLVTKSSEWVISKPQRAS